jgi:hypothetical protein
MRLSRCHGVQSSLITYDLLLVNGAAVSELLLSDHDDVQRSKLAESQCGDGLGKFEPNKPCATDVPMAALIPYRDGRGEELAGTNSVAKPVRTPSQTRRR